MVHEDREAGGNHFRCGAGLRYVAPFHLTLLAISGGSGSWYLASMISGFSAERVNVVVGLMSKKLYAVERRPDLL